MARHFVPWLALEPERRWLDMGCGTGVLELAAAREAVGIDPSEGFLVHARPQTG